MSPRPRLGVMGGTFDPPHLGHLAAASEAHTRLDLDAVLFVPAGQPWQKADRTLSSARHRLAMTRLAVEHDSRFQVSEVDLARAGPTYTVDTLADLRAQHGDDAEFFLLLGADALAGFGSWHRAAEVARACTLVGVSRPGAELRAPGPPAEEVILLTVPGTSISSTECRERFAADVPNIYLVPDSVIAYAQDHALYGGAR
jgi:nicotinate-nucleotide adenylyltransferase